MPPMPPPTMAIESFLFLGALRERPNTWEVRYRREDRRLDFSSILWLTLEHALVFFFDQDNMTARLEA